jgi:LysR family transcriptional activator of nhaA
MPAAPPTVPRPPFNYRHLYYFWVVAQQGGMTRAADVLGVAVQTVGTQVRALEHDLGVALLRPAGRGLALTDAGRAALQQAEQIFQLGQSLPERVRGVAGRAVVRLRVGVSDGVPKLVVRQLMQPVLQQPDLRLLCHEDRFDDLLADLALHRLDVVLSDRPAPGGHALRLYSHALAASGVAWYAPSALARASRLPFPQALAELPVLLPTGHAAVRESLDRWFEQHGVRPRIVGEFEDSALLKTFGASGMGVFPAVDLVHDDLVQRYDVKRVGACEGVEEHFFAIGTEKKVLHPLVQRLLPAPRAPKPQERHPA